MCLKRFGAWEEVKYILGVGGVCGRRGCLLHVRFPPSTAWKLKSLTAFHMLNKGNIVTQYYHYYLSVDFNSSHLVGINYLPVGKYCKTIFFSV